MISAPAMAHHYCSTERLPRSFSGLCVVLLRWSMRPGQGPCSTDRRLRQCLPHRPRQHWAVARNVGQRRVAVANDQAAQIGADQAVGRERAHGQALLGEALGQGLIVDLAGQAQAQVQALFGAGDARAVAVFAQHRGQRLQQAVAAFGVALAGAAQRTAEVAHFNELGQRGLRRHLARAFSLALSVLWYRLRDAL